MKGSTPKQYWIDIKDKKIILNKHEQLNTNKYKHTNKYKQKFKMTYTDAPWQPFFYSKQNIYKWRPVIGEDYETRKQKKRRA